MGSLNSAVSRSKVWLSVIGGHFLSIAVLISAVGSALCTAGGSIHWWFKETFPVLYFPRSLSPFNPGCVHYTDTYSSLYISFSTVQLQYLHSMAVGDKAKSAIRAAACRSLETTVHDYYTLSDFLWNMDSVWLKKNLFYVSVTNKLKDVLKL